MGLNYSEKAAAKSTSPPQSSGPSSKPVGLLVVHGVGKQKQGETLDGVLKGLEVAYGNKLSIQREDKGYALIKGLNRPIHIFEVYWADLLHGEIVKGTFDVDRVFEIVWFPLLNYKSGLLPRRLSKTYVLSWTFILAPLSSFLATGIQGAQLLGAVLTGLKRSSPLRQRQLEIEKSQTFWENVRQKADMAVEQPTIVDDMLDQVAGDVFNYTQGVINAFPEVNDQSAMLARNAEEIHNRFRQTAQQAIDKGCNELQILAHSLGTVVAFRSMCPEINNNDADIDTPVHLSRFYTIGSPLEKFRFFWPRLLQGAANGPAIPQLDDSARLASFQAENKNFPMSWDNFYNRSDLVSGQLLSFDGWPEPTNHKAQGLGGMIRSHVSYNRNPKFLSLFGKGLTGTEPAITVNRFHNLVQKFIGVLENLLLPALLLFFALLGLVFMMGLGGVVGWIISQPFEWLGLENVAIAIRFYFVLVIILGLTIFPMFVGKANAKKLHTQYWRPRKTP